MPLDVEAQRAEVTGIIGELKSQSSLFDGFESGRESLIDVGAVPSAAEACLLWCLRPGLRVVHADRLEQVHQAIEYARLQPFERQARGLRPPSREPQRWWWRWLNPANIPFLGPRIAEPGDECRALATLAATAVALRRFRLDRGNYPANLNELVPAFLPRVLVDPYTGRAPEYKRAGSGFELKVNTPWKVPRLAAQYTWKIAR